MTRRPYPRRPPSGMLTSDGRMQIAVRFDPALFARIVKMAQREGKTFSATVCELCRVGIFDLEESDRHEPAA